MKKIITVVSAVVILCFFSPAVMADAPSLNVSDYQVTENVNPGDNFRVFIQLSNNSENDAEAVDVQVKASYPVSSVGIDKKSISELKQGEGENLEFRLKIEETAIEGSYPVEFLISYEDSDGMKYSKNYIVNVFVSGEKELSLYLTESSKTDIYSDETATLTFVALNKGSVDIESLVAEASAEDALEVKWDSKESVLGKLSPQESVKFPIRVETQKATESDNYPLRIWLNGKNFNLERVYDIPVKGLPDFQIKFIETEDLHPNKESAKVTVDFKNAGTEEGEEIEGRLLPEYPFSTEMTTHYIQEMQSGETDSMTFWLDVDEDSEPGSYALTLSLDYEAWGEDFSETVKVPLHVEARNSPEFLEFQYWWQAPISVVIITLLVVIIALSFVTWRKL